MDDLERSISRRGVGDPEHGDLAGTEASRRRLIARLVGLRKSNGLTQAAVAESMRVGQSVIAEIESGRTDVRLSTLERYANAVSLGQLRLELAGDLVAGSPAGRVGEAAAAYGPAVDEADFWVPPSLGDLIAQQRTSPIKDPQSLVLEGISERDWEAFFVAMGLPE